MNGVPYMDQRLRRSETLAACSTALTICVGRALFKTGR
ncbi:hypothetical protein ILFOPFJJ_00341 [Ensifer psoraleae]|nr:hypothetical protein [Sinorhizobium psoraleae]